MKRSAPLIALFAAAAAAPAAAQDAPPERRVVRGARVWTGAPETAGGDAAQVVVRDGDVVAVGPEALQPPGAVVDAYPGAWIGPGFVDPDAGLGALGDRDEAARPLAPDVRLSWLANPDHPDFAAARAAGITTVALTPGDRALLGGVGALLKTTGAGFGELPGPLKLAFWGGALSDERPPTSRAGAARLLRRALAEAEARDAGPLVALADGQHPALVTVGDREDVRLATAVLGDAVVLLLGDRFGVGDLEGLDLSGVTCVLGPFDLDTPRRVLRLPAALAARGVPIVFASGAPAAPAAGLRLTAILAVRHGLDEASALDALTGTTAAVLGVDERVGALTPGRDADLVVFDGHPLRPASRLLAVYVDGRRVYRAPATAEASR